MLFSDMFFVLAFLSVYLLVYFITDQKVSDIKTKNLVLCLFSLLFYLFGGLFGVVILLAATLVGYAGGLVIDTDGGSRKLKLAFFVGVLSALLIFFKYTGTYTGLVMPIGLSFYTFKQIAYLADVYMERISAERDLPDYFLYVACFHHVVQGPILRYKDIQDALKDRHCDADSLSEGMQRFCLGLAKKVILADHLGELADSLVPKTADIAYAPTAAIWLGSICFSIQLYLDFSAYTDMAIGLGRMVGFTYPENFDYPYLARSVKQFWRKWHMSLSFFFRDYVYIPLGGNRKGRGRRIFNLFVVWLLTGMWHGNTWNFVIWGMYYFLFLLFEEYVPIEKSERVPIVVKHLYAIFVFNLGWLIFRFENFSQLGYAIKGFFGFSGNGFTTQACHITVQNNIFFLLVAVLACAPILKKFEDIMIYIIDKKKFPAGIYYGLRTVFILGLFILSLILMAGSTYQPFLYQQF